MIKNQMSVRTAIAARLKLAREAAYADAESFCKANDFPLALYLQHESAAHAMLASEIMAYCKALNISIYQLVLGEEREDLKNYGNPN